MLQQSFAAESETFPPYAQDCVTTTEPEVTKREDNILAMIKEVDHKHVLPHTVIPPKIRQVKFSANNF